MRSTILRLDCRVHLLHARFVGGQGNVGVHRNRLLDIFSPLCLDFSR